MTTNQIILVRQTFGALVPKAEFVATTFYNRLFAINPGLKNAFPTDLSDQKRRLMRTLYFAVASLEQMENMQPVIGALARKHIGYGLREEHFGMVTAVLLQTFREHLGSQRFTTQAEIAWTMVFTGIEEAMRRAARSHRLETTIMV